MNYPLEQLQKDFQAYLTDGSHAVEDYIQPMAKAQPQEGLGAYAFAYWARLVDVLADDYQAVDALIANDDEFIKLGRAYLAAHPPTHFSVNYFGKRFSDYLRSHTDYPEYYADLAEFEWAMGMAVVKPDAPVLATDDLASIEPEAWPDLKVALHPSLEVIALHYPSIPALMLALRESKELPEMVRSEQQVMCAIWCHDLRSFYHVLTDQEWQMLEARGKSQSFSEVCELVSQWYDDEEEVVQQVACSLRYWVEAGVVSCVI